MKNKVLSISALLVFMLVSCKQVTSKVDSSALSVSHSSVSEPDYNTVFPNNTVLRMDIKIDSVDWSKMQTNLKKSLRPMRPPRKNSTEAPLRPPNMGSGKNLQADSLARNNFRAPRDKRGVHATTDPIWIPCDIHFKNEQWTNVGIRLKGNSSLHTTYERGIKKYSFKLDFDEFEDDYPEIKNQRFYGFKQINLNNNYDDASLMREKVAADLFRDFGLVSARTSFCAIYVDTGSGIPQYYGVYTLVEEMDDSVLKNQLQSKNGNLYKPEKRAATFAFGSFNEDELNKKNHASKKDYSDVKQFYEILHSDNRIKKPEVWMEQLDSIFNVDAFLKWLAANTTIQNWDSYGRAAHNYYLYNNPADGRLMWIPWDNNEAFQKGKMGGALDFSMNIEKERWPIIEHILSQPQYKKRFETYLAQFSREVYSPDAMSAKLAQYEDMLLKYAKAEEPDYTFIKSGETFDFAVDVLQKHAQARTIAIAKFIKANEALVHLSELNK